MSRRKNKQTGEFIPEIPDAQLADRIRTVVLSIDEDWPLDVTAAQYNAKRNDGREPPLPAAQTVQRRWRMDWPEIAEMLTTPGRDVRRTLSARARTQRGGVDEQDVVFALKLIAGRLGVDTLAPAQYDKERGEIEGEVGSRWKHGQGREQALPTAADIDEALRKPGLPGWTAGLRAAGLRDRKATGPPTGLSWEEATELFLADVGHLAPSIGVLRIYTSNAGVALAAKGDMERARKATIAKWRSMGRWAPDRAPPPSKRPPMPTQAASVPAGATPTYGQFRTRAQIIAGFVLAHRAANEQGKPLTQRLHREIATGNPAIPHPSRVDRFAKKSKPPTTAKALLAEAAELV